MTDRIRESDGEVADAVHAMYAAYPDSARFDAHLHPEITIWETDQPGSWIGLPELSELRDHRRAVDPVTGGSAAAVPVLSVENLLVDRWGSTAAVARYVLRAVDPGETPDVPEQRHTRGSTAFRVTDVWDLVTVDGARTWQIVHHHAEAL